MMTERGIPLSWLKALMTKIELRLSFIALALISIALGYTEQFFILFLSVTLHEVAHIAAAAFFGLPIKKIIVTPLGQMAVIADLESEIASRRAVIYMAGPMISLLLFLLFLLLNKPDLQTYVSANLTLCLVNLLPVYPLDGGQLCRLVLGNTLGVVRANRSLTAFGKMVSVLLMLAGLVQAVLFPYNISLYCVGFFLWKASAREYVNMTYTFYKDFFQPVRRAKKILSVKMVVAHQNESVKAIVARLRWDYFFAVYVTDGQKIIRRVTEDEIVRHVTLHGLVGTLGDIGEDSG